MMITLKANLSKEEWSKFHGSYQELRSQVVEIKHSEFPDATWLLRLPEQVTTDKDPQTGPYQIGMQWKGDARGWGFAPCPINGLNGTIKGEIASSETTVDFSLTVRNESSEIWKRGLAWLCFNHLHAKKYYQYKNYVCCDGSICTTPPDAMEHYCIKGYERDWWEKGELTPSEALIATRCIGGDNQEFSIGIAAEQGIMLGQNPGWPCTDIALLFGDLLPGKSTTVRGKIYFNNGTPEDLLDLYRSDFGPHEEHSS